MTVTDPGLCLTPTKGLATPSRFLPTKIPVPHHQLRHFISTSEGDHIYYVNNHDVFVLDLTNNQKSIIATIPFEARCLAADLGWVAVGGELNGNCAFFEVEKDENGRPICFVHHLEIKLLGGEIVNSMNIHNMVSDGDALDEPVVLISNNDKSVKIFSLAQRKVLATLSHPVPMNFAAMSPDATIVAAVGDSDKVYFYQRARIENKRGSDRISEKYVKYEWKIFAEPLVPQGDPVYDDYSFAVAFSPSGHLCACSSQGGAITVFDMHRLVSAGEPAEKSMLCTFQSSRPTLWGCVRAMAFSPEPWDLLAWAEDHGRVGLADVRRHFIRRQVLELDQQKTETVDLEDGTPRPYRDLAVQERLRAQHLAHQGYVGAITLREVDGQLVIEDGPRSPERRHSRQDLLSYHQGLGLDARERSVINALETTMDNVEPLTTRPYSINYASSPRLRGSATSSDVRREHEAYPLNPTLSPTAPSSSVRHHQPRRRTSVVLSESRANDGQYLMPSDLPRARLSASPGRMEDDDQEDEIPIMSTNALISSARGTTGVETRLSSSSNRIPDSDPWHVIQNALEIARESDSGDLASLTRIEAALEAERHRLESRADEELRAAHEHHRQSSDLLARLAQGLPPLTDSATAHQGQGQETSTEGSDLDARSFPTASQVQLLHEGRLVHQRAWERLSAIDAEAAARRLHPDRGERFQDRSSRTASVTSIPSSTATSLSARTSALPTTTVGPVGGAENGTAILTDSTDMRRQRLAHIELLQRQVRRAESRVALATSDIQALETAVRLEYARRDANRSTGTTRNDEEASLRDRAAAVLATALPAAEESTNQRESSQAATTTRRTLAPPSSVRRGGRVYRVSEGTDRERVPDADLRLARMMFLSGMSGTRSLDANGNWRPGAGLHRVLAGASSLGMGSSSSSLTTAGPASAADAVREMGPGTAGIGFSPDGRYLYAGSEEGIYEFKVNLRDRMMFPAFEMR